MAKRDGNAEDIIAQELSRMRPRPARVVSYTDDGKETELSMRAGRGRWKRVAVAAVSQLAAGREVRALDKHGALQRSWSEDEFERIEPAAPVERDKPVTADDVMSAPIEQADLSRLRLFAELEDRNLERMRTFLKTMTDGYQTMFARLLERNEQIEKTNHKLLTTVVEALVNRGEAEGEFLALQAEVERLRAAGVGGEDGMQLAQLERLLGMARGETAGKLGNGSAS